MRMSVTRAYSIFVAAALLLSGCVSQRETMIEQGYPESYADGFEDGCHSGSKAGGNLFEQFREDVRRFDVDDDYAQGWSDAFRQCETEQEALDRQTRMGMEWQHMDDYRKDRMAHEALEGLDTRGLENLQ